MSDKNYDLSDSVQREKYWTEYAVKHLKGKVIKEVRYLTDDEMENMYWDEKALVIIFNDGSLLLPSQDPEGNGAGTLFGQTSKGDDLTFPSLY